MAYSEAVAQRGINSQWEGLIQQVGAANGVPPALIKAIISQESAWNANAVNPADPSYGLMQLNAHYWGTPDVLLIPENNINIGTSILRDQLNRLGDMALAIAAYNAGTSRSAEDLAARITNNTNNVGSYVGAVLNYYNYFVAAYGGSDQGGGGGDVLPPPVDGNGLPVNGPSQTGLIAAIGIALLAALAFLFSQR